jgi:hypothetical protein
MFESAILDVVIGLVFIYLALSLICSASVELLEAFLHYRASDLERGLEELLQDPGRAKIVAELYKHPLVDSLYPGQYFPQQADRRRNGTMLPAYVPAANFALALLDIVRRGTAETASGAANCMSGPTRPVTGGAARPGSLPAGAQSPVPPPITVGAGGTAAAAVPVNPPPVSDVGLPGVAPVGAPGVPAARTGTAGPEASPVMNLRQAIPTCPLLSGNEDMQRTLFTLVDAAGGDMNQVRANIEGWYNSAMDRVSGWYKRRSQLVTLVLCLFIVVVANIDTIAIGNALARNKALRDVLVSGAQDFSKVGGTPTAGNAAQWLQTKLENVSPLGMPIGWGQLNMRWDTPGVVQRLVGWVVTAIAVTLGAPFWFDVLNRFIVVRSTVKPHEKSPEEASRG